MNAMNTNLRNKIKNEIREAEMKRNVGKKTKGCQLGIPKLSL